MSKISKILVLLMLYPVAVIADQPVQQPSEKAPPAEYGRLFLGGESGVSFISNGLKSNLNLGLELGAQLLPNLSVGVRGARIFVKSQEISVAGIPVKSDDHITLLLGMINVHPWENLRGLFLGARGGVGISGFSGSVGSVSSSESKSNIAWGPAVGADVRIGYGMTIGAEADLLFKGTEEEVAPGLQSSRGASTIAEIFGTIKYWF